MLENSPITVFSGSCDSTDQMRQYIRSYISTCWILSLVLYLFYEAISFVKKNVDKHDRLFLLLYQPITIVVKLYFWHLKVQLERNV